MTEEQIRPIAENYVEEFCHDINGEYTDGDLVCAGIGTALIVARKLERKNKELKEENELLKSKVFFTVECDKAQKDGEFCLGYGREEDEPCEQCKNCIKCEAGYYQLGETGKDEELDNLQKQIEQLKKENAELKERNRGLLESCEGATMMYKDLCKAKELLKDWLQIAHKNHAPHCYGFLGDTEQFLKEGGVSE